MRKSWPIRLEPTTLPSWLIREPSALPGKSDLGDAGQRQRVDEAEDHRERDDREDEVAVAAHLRKVRGQALDDRAEQQSGEERERADEDHDPDQQEDEGRRVGAHRPEAGRGDVLAGQSAGHRQHEEDREEAGGHRRAAEQVGEATP